MKYTLYLGDWYYNAGIIGFINTIGENEPNIDRISEKFGKDLEIGENYLIFDSKILTDFLEKFEKTTFLNFFESGFYANNSETLIEELKQGKKSIKKAFEERPALYRSLIEVLIGKEELERIKEQNDTGKFIKIIESFSFVDSNKNQIYQTIKSKGQEGYKFINQIFEVNISDNITELNGLKECINLLIEGIEPEKKSKNNTCLFCGRYKKEYDFTTSISKILGFNSDNSNWVWGYYSNKIRICPLCALVFFSVPNGLAFIQRKIDSENKSYFYFVNRNSDIKNLHRSFWLFKKNLFDEVYQKKPFHLVADKLIYKIIKEKSQKFTDNINFIEIGEKYKDSRGRKTFQIYNYNIPPRLSSFIVEYIDKYLPHGYYIIRETRYQNYFDLSEEILKKTIEESLDYDELFKYYNIFFRSLKTPNKYVANFDLKRLSEYVLIFINFMRGKDMEELEKIISKAYFNGRDLSNKIGQENKIKSIAYQLLNDLRVGDREAFLDKYLRLVISYSSESKIGSNNELSDMDKFMSFGYSFINGLLSYLNNKEESNKGV